MFIYETIGVSKSGEEVKDFGAKYRILVRKAQLDGCRHSQRWIQDFPEVGAPAGEGATYQISSKIAWNWKNLDVPRVPP